MRLLNVTGRMVFQFNSPSRLRHWCCVWLLVGTVLVIGMMPQRARGRDDSSSPLQSVFHVYIPIVVTHPAPDDWLAYVNYYRAMADLPPVVEDEMWSRGGFEHARYMVKNDYIGQMQDTSNPWYTPLGAEAGLAGNVLASANPDTSDYAAIDQWMQSPFHAVGIIDPKLQQVGYGSYRDDDGGVQMAAVLDVMRGLGDIAPSISFPIAWPAQGKTVPLLEYQGIAFPNPLRSCPGYQAPTGLPIILQLGSGDVIPDVTAHAFRSGDTDLPHCVFDETSYRNPDPDRQILGRAALAPRDAIVLIPRRPLQPGTEYTVSITANGQTYTWTFNTAHTASSQDTGEHIEIR